MLLRLQALTAKTKLSCSGITEKFAVASLKENPTEVVTKKLEIQRRRGTLEHLRLHDGTGVGNDYIAPIDKEMLYAGDNRKAGLAIDL